MKTRTKARGIALQSLYEFDLTGHPAALILEQRKQEDPLDPELQNFVDEIVLGIIPHITKIDQLIAKHAPEWPLDQVASIDRNIIRIAFWEIAIKKCTPVKVAINEAVEVSKIFGSDASPRFVNGVLGSLVAQQAEYQHMFEG